MHANNIGVDTEGAGGFTSEVGVVNEAQLPMLLV